MTPEQIDRLRLPTAPPKESDNRAFYGCTTENLRFECGAGNATCQAEAIAPDDLATILREAIEARIDQRALSRVRRQEAKARWELIERLSSFDEKEHSTPPVGRAREIRRLIHASSPKT